MDIESKTNFTIPVVSIKMVKENEFKCYRKKISTPNDCYDLISNFLKDMDREYFIVVTVDTKNIVTSININSIGNLNSSIVHPREVFKTAILSNSASVIVAHNHPSGDTTPSDEDIAVTRRLKESGSILGIQLLDHIIVGEDGEYISLRKKGFI